MSAAQENSFLELTGLENKSFSLLWRGSRDGFDITEFHKLCDGKANTVTVIKNTNGFIFGGFTSTFVRVHRELIKQTAQRFCSALLIPVILR